MNEKSCAFSVIILRLITFISPLIKGRASRSSLSPLMSICIHLIHLSPGYILLTRSPLISVSLSVVLFAVFPLFHLAIDMHHYMWWKWYGNITHIQTEGQSMWHECQRALHSKHGFSITQKPLEQAIWAQQAPAAAAIKCVRVFVCRKDEKRASLIPRSSLS